jgi:hypothetical protein
MIQGCKMAWFCYVRANMRKKGLWDCMTLNSHWWRVSGGFRGERKGGGFGKQGGRGNN